MNEALDSRADVDGVPVRWLPMAEIPEANEELAVTWNHG